MLLIVYDYLLARSRGRTIGDEIFKSAIGVAKQPMLFVRQAEIRPLVS